MWVLVVLFKFRDGSVETRELWRGEREGCERRAAALDRAGALGVRGIRYDGGRDEVPLAAIVAVREADEDGKAG